jgi:hypothetical protein
MGGKESHETKNTSFRTVFLARHNEGVLVPRAIGPPIVQGYLRPFARCPGFDRADE